MPGPPRKPTAIRVLEGSRAHRPLPNEPAFRAGIPSKPKKISRRAAPIWDELIDEMATADILRTVDRRALWQLSEDEALLGEVYDGVWKMAATIQAEATSQKKKLPGGPVMALLTMKGGRLAMSSLRDLAARVIVQRREFGLTPAARARLDVEPGSGAGGGTVDPIEAKLCG